NSGTEGTINSWLVKDGDHVNKYDPMADVMTDKVTAEVPSSFTGTIKEIVAKEGDTIAVGELMCYVETEGNSDYKAESKESKPKDTKKVQTDDLSMKTRYSPAVLRLSQEHNIDLSLVEGTGRGGRITRKDLEKIIEEGSIPSQKTASSTDERAEEVVEAKKATAQASETLETAVGDLEIPVKGVRKVIADNMVKSKTEIPHAWMTVEVDVTNLVNYRNKIKDEFKANEGYNLTYFSFFVKAVAQALKEFPQINSLWSGDKIIQKKDV